MGFDLTGGCRVGAEVELEARNLKSISKPIEGDIVFSEN